MSKKIGKHTDFRKKLAKIKIVLTDVDGCLTDGGMYYTENGLTMKKYNVKDGMGAVLLKSSGYITGLISSDASMIGKIRGEKLQFNYTVIGTYEKLAAAKKICEEQNCTLEAVAFMGDDVNDLELLKEVGVSAAPRDAVEEVKKAAMYVCKRRGGKGAYREFVDMILASTRKEK